MKDIIDILKEEGLTIFEGKESTLNAIKSVADCNDKPLCSGWRVFPDGTKCDGCKDCYHLRSLPCH